MSNNFKLHNINNINLFIAYSTDEFKKEVEEKKDK